MKTKFEVGQLWRTRDGNKALICHVNATESDPDYGKDYPVLAFIDSNKVSFSKEGNYFCEDDYTEHKFDLVELIVEDKESQAPEMLDADYLKELWIKVWVDTHNKTGAMSDANYRARQAVAEFRKEFHAD